MGNRVLILLFLIAVLSFLFTAASWAVLAIRKKQSLRIGMAAWAALFFAVTVPMNLWESPVDLILYNDYTGGVRIEVETGGEETAEMYIPASVLRAAVNSAAVLSTVWIAAAAASFSYGMSSYFNNVHFLTKRSKTCRDERANTIFEGACAKAGIRQHVPLRVMDSGLKISPCTCGILSHSVFVGEDYLREYSDEWLELIFLHELIHVRRRDTLLKLLTLAATSFHALLPTAGRIRRAVQEDSEYLCDLEVLRRTGEKSRTAYISVIVDVAERNVKNNCRDADLLSSVSAAGSFILERYRNMRNRPSRGADFRKLIPVFLTGILVNFLLLSAVDLPNIGNPGVDIADDLTRTALCEYFGLENPERLTAAHMEAVYAIAYDTDDNRALCDGELRFSRKVVINEGLFLTEAGYLPSILPESAPQASCSILPRALRMDMFDCDRYPEEFYLPSRDEPGVSPCSPYVPVYLLRQDLPDEDIAAYLAQAGESDQYSIWKLGDRTVNLCDLTLFTGLRTLSVSKLLTPSGYELTGETGFAVIYH